MDRSARPGAAATPKEEEGELVELVRSRYAEAARAALGSEGTCCGAATNQTAGCEPAANEAAAGWAAATQAAADPPTSRAGPSLDARGAPVAAASVDDPSAFGIALYGAAEAELLPEAARLASLGCGNPTAVAELRPGEIVLDLGSGGGVDVLLSARRVGPTGFAYGLDMTPEMIELARRNTAEARVANIEFLEGRIEAIPLPDASVDVVISNCVINLSTDKPAVLREIARVLRPGGRIGVADVVAADHLSPAERAARGSFVGCIAGALSFGEYEAGLRAVGLVDVSVRPTHEVADGMFAAIVRARKPATG